MDPMEEIKQTFFIECEDNILCRRIVPEIQPLA